MIILSPIPVHDWSPEMHKLDKALRYDPIVDASLIKNIPDNIYFTIERGSEFDDRWYARFFTR